MDASTIALASSLAVAVVAIAALGFRLSGLVPEQRAIVESLLLQGRAQLDSERQMRIAEAARDAALRREAEAQAGLAKTTARLLGCERLLTDLLAKGARDAVDKIRTAPTDDDALAALRELLAPVSGVPDPGGASGAPARGDRAAADPV